MLYLLKSFGRNNKSLLKIGYASDYKRRFAQYQSHNPFIEGISTREGDLILERKLHIYLRYVLFEKKVGTEWYPDCDLVRKNFHIKESFLNKFIWKHRNVLLSPYIIGDVEIYNQLVSLFNIKFEGIELMTTSNTIDKLLYGLDSCDTFLSNPPSKKVLEVLENFCKLGLFTEKMKLLVNSLPNLTPEEFTYIMNRIPIKFATYINVLGIDKIRALNYRNEALENEINFRVKLKDELFSRINEYFKVGEKYTRVFIKDKLQEIYNKYNLNNVAKAMDLNRYFDIKPCKVTLNDKREPAILILNLK